MFPSKTIAAILLAGVGLTGCGQTTVPPDTQPAPASISPVTPITAAPATQPNATPVGAPPATTAPAPKPAGEDAPAAPSTAIPPFVAYGQAPPTLGVGEPKLAPTPTTQAPPGTPLPPQQGVAAPTKPLPTAQAPPPPPEPKEKLNGSVPAYEWPEKINGKLPSEFVKDTLDPDPAIREMALRTLVKFGPMIRKEAGVAKAVIARMDGTKETDPGVRAAAFEAAGAIASYDPSGALGFADEADTREAIRLLYMTSDQAASGGSTRLHAIQTLTSFGPKAEAAISYLVGGPAADKAYETRRSVAMALGKIGYHEMNGPNHKAMNCLVNNLAHDPSAAVRMESVQSIILLGPVYIPRTKGPLLKDIKDPNDAPVVDEKMVATFVASLKKRLTTAPKIAGERPSQTGLVERDPQVEIYLRLALMRLDPKECNDENLNAIVRYIGSTQTGVRMHALIVLGMIGEFGGKKIDEVVKVLNDPNPDIVLAAATALASMGWYARPAIPALEKLKERGENKQQKEWWATRADQAIKIIKDAKPPAPPAPPEPPKKKTGFGTK